MPLLALKQHIYSKGVVHDAGLTENTKALVSRDAPRKPLPLFVLNYKKHYRLLVEKALERVSCNQYTEKHHILPKCLGGPDDPENIVSFTAREHFVAHWLLHRAYPNHGGLAQAFVAMCSFEGRNHKRYTPSSRAVAEAAEAAAKRMSKKISCYTADGKKKETFDSIIEAANKYGVSGWSIGRVANGNNETSAGLKWQFGEEPKVTPFKTYRGFPVYQYTPDKIFIREFVTAEDAAKAVGGKRKVIVDSSKSQTGCRYGFFWTRTKIA